MVPSTPSGRFFIGERMTDKLAKNLLDGYTRKDCPYHDDEMLCDYSDKKCEALCVRFSEFLENFTEEIMNGPVPKRISKKSEKQSISN